MTLSRLLVVVGGAVGLAGAVGCGSDSTGQADADVFVRDAAYDVFDPDGMGQDCSEAGSLDAEGGSPEIFTDESVSGNVDSFVDSDTCDSDSSDTGEPDSGAGEIIQPDADDADSGMEEIVCSWLEIIQAEPPEIGETVPDFSGIGHNVSCFRLSDHQDGYVLISSFPSAYTVYCTRQNDYIRDNMPEFESRNVLPVGLTTDSVENLAGWAQEKNYAHILLSDADPFAGISSGLGLYSAETLVDIRALFLVGPDQTLLYKAVYERMQDPDFQALFDFIDSRAFPETGN